MPRSNHSIQKFFAELGPGLITGAADDDPSGIATYSVSGAGFGYGPLWTALFCFPLMAAVQLCVRASAWSPAAAWPPWCAGATRAGCSGARACC